MKLKVMLLVSLLATGAMATEDKSWWDKSKETLSSWVSLGKEKYSEFRASDEYDSASETFKLAVKNTKDFYTDKLLPSFEEFKTDFENYELPEFKIDTEKLEELKNKSSDSIDAFYNEQVLPGLKKTGETAAEFKRNNEVYSTKTIHSRALALADVSCGDDMDCKEVIMSEFEINQENAYENFKQRYKASKKLRKLEADLKELSELQQA